MKAAERSADPGRGIAPWEAGEEPSFLDVSITNIPGVNMVYQSLKEWQAECKPRVYPQREENRL